MSVDTVHKTIGARRLMERVLRSGQPIDAEYPLVFDAAGPGKLVAVERDGEVRSACSILVRELVMPRACVRAGFVGSVVTDPEYRERGLASEVLIAAEHELRRAGTWIALLWADSAEFYTARGYHEISSEIDVVIPLELVAHLPPPRNVRERRPEDDEAIHALYVRHPERVERTPEETHALLGSPEMEVLVCERWGRIHGYTCLGRGKDFTDVVHEWAGDALTVLALVRAHLERRIARGIQRDVFVMAPPSAKDLVARLTALGAPWATGILSLGKILDARACAQLCARLLDPQGRVHIADLETSTDHFAFHGPNGVVTRTSEDLAQLLFPARGDRTALDAFAAALGTSDASLPLAPFVWGLDSI